MAESGSEHEEPKPAFRVSDRRFWAAEGEPAEAGEAPAGETRTEYPTYVEQLRAELAEKDKQLREYIAAYKDAVGKGLEDVKARLQREAARELERSRARAVEELFEVADNLERSLQAAEAAKGPEALAGLLSGLRAVASQFQAKLAGLGLSRIETLGAAFDPRVHEALGTAPGPEGTVVTEVRPGYRQGDHVLRAAQVLVGRAS